MGQQIRVRNKAILAVIGTALLLDLGLGIGIVTASEALPWRLVFAWEAAAMAAIFFAVWIWHSRRIAFLREASVIAAAVMESDTSNLPIGGDWHSWWLGSSPRNTADALEQEDQGLSEDVLYIVKVRLRFRPGWTSEQLNWDDLRDDVPHVDVTMRLLSGGWGTFACGLTRGSLVSLLYSPQNPRDCRIVRRFRSTLTQIEKMESVK